jgi:4-amino-4-deoxy-L-arabinose transferase-like glycosyltransferase
MVDPDQGFPKGLKVPGASWAWVPWGLALVLLALGLSIWEPLPPGIWHDDGVYVLLGRSIAEGDGLRYVGLPGEPLAPKFPPLLPLLLGFLWVLSPSFPENVLLLGGLNLVVTALSAGVFCAYLRKVLEVPPSVALGLTGFAWISAHLWRVAAIPLSEPVFLLSLLFALWAGGRMESKRGIKPVVLFLLAGGLALYARTLGIAVLAAGVLSLALEGRRKTAFRSAGASLALLLPWMAWGRWATASIPEPLLDTLGPYSGWLLAQIRHQPWEFVGFLVSNAGHLVGRLLTLLLPGVSGFPRYLGLVLVPVFLLGLWELFRRSKILALTLLCSFGILLIWPFQDVRLLVPYQPFLILAVAAGFWRIVSLGNLWRPLRVGASVVAMAWVACFLTVSVSRLATGWTLEAYRIRSEALLQAVQAVNGKTPSDAVVGAPELWPGIHLYTGRTVVPSARFRPLAGDAPVQGTVEEQYQIWIQAGLTHLVVEHGGRVHGDALDRIDALCSSGTVQVLDSGAGQALVVLFWDRACQERVLGPVGGAGDRG